MLALARSVVLRLVAPSSFVVVAACASARTPAPVPDDPVLGKPLVIHGQRVPWSELRQVVCEGSAGAGAIESARVVILIGDELQRRVKNGGSGIVSLDPNENDEEEMKAFKEEMERAIADEPPTIVGEARRLREVFEKVFLPRDPDQFPPATVEALLSQPGGEQVIDHYKEAFAANTGDPNSKPRNAAEREFDEAVEQQVFDYLLENAKVEPAPAPGVLYRVNGVDIKTDDIWAQIAPSLSEFDVREAKQWIVNTTVLREALEQAGAWLSDEEAEAAYHVLSDPYKDSTFSIERLALWVKRFPSIERYKEYRRIYESFARMKAAEMTPAALQKQAEFRTNSIVGLVTVDVDVLLCSAWDFEKGRWLPNGWEEAERRTKDVMKLLVDEQKPWEALLDQYSEWPEPPAASDSDGSPAPNAPQKPPPKGRFRSIQRNNLLAELGESEYGQFLNGSSITDSIFYGQEVGTLGTPQRGPFGWYLPRLLRRSATPEKLDIDPDTMKILITEDWLLWNLEHWTQELVRQAM